jgi:hypothetical protein
VRKSDVTLEIDARGGTMAETTTPADADANATTTTTTTTVATIEDSAATRAFDVVARTLALAAEARGPAERKRSQALLEGAVKQYVAELDEMRAMCEREASLLGLEHDAGAGVDEMETN